MDTGTQGTGTAMRLGLLRVGAVVTLGTLWQSLKKGVSVQHTEGGERKTQYFDFNTCFWFQLAQRALSGIQSEEIKCIYA